MTVEMVAPAWMHQQVTAEQYAAWTQEQCAGIEIVDGMVLVSPSASKRPNRLARLLANALDAAAGPDWNADIDFDVRLQDVPLNNRRPGRRRPTGSSRLTSTRGPAFSSTGGLSRPPPAHLSFTPTSSIPRPVATVTATSSPAS